MEFRIADTFTTSLAKLTGDEQKAVKTTAFDLQLNPANPGMSFHKLNGSKDPHFWSVRVSLDIRLIVHKTESSLLLCYVDHHDAAYRWAERRKLETHPKTGAAQLVEIRETVQEITVPRYVEEYSTAPEKPALFQGVAEDVLLGYGVPVEWLPDVRSANEDTLLELTDHLPAEAAEALLELATGGKPAPAERAAPGTDPFQHPDAQRRFRVMNDVEELARALEFPWDKWTIFLHPAQREWVEKDYNGPARVSGSAGTGKTIVALHRAVHLARSNPDSRVLLTTFSETLANALRTKFFRLVRSQPRLAERIDVDPMDSIANRLYAKTIRAPNLVSRDDLRERLVRAAAADGLKYGASFLLSEWEDVVDAWQIADWEGYRDVRRLGRKTRLPESQRASLWAVFEHVRAELEGAGLQTQAEIYNRLSQQLKERNRPPYEYVVVDEAQDVSVPQLRFLAALGAGKPNALFFAGDLGQRIFQQPFSWLSAGVDVRGRARTLHINYRTSHQIRSHADRLLDPELADVDGNIEVRRGTVSVFNGPAPQVCVYSDEQAEIETVGEWVRTLLSSGVAPEEVAVVVRGEPQLPRARAAVEAAGAPCRGLAAEVEPEEGAVSLATMHFAKGLEFRAVCVMACDDEVIPSQERIDAVGDAADLEEVYKTERHLLYVACTRARDQLLVTSTEPASEFLEDLDSQ